MRLGYWLFAASVAWIAYVWIGYPLLLKGITLIYRFRGASAMEYCPTVSVLISARNECKDIGWKVRQTLAWEYPSERLEVLVGSDASTDGTDAEVTAVGDPRLTLVRNRERLGKNLTLNRLAQLATGELFFFTDANTYIDAKCLKKVVRHFADSRVGCVTGMECNVTGAGTSPITGGSNAYLQYESLIDRLESQLGSVLVCDGSVYCLRRTLFSELDADLANDLEHPIRAGATGAAVIFEPEARSMERCSSSPTEEFSRRRRIAAQGALGMWRLRRELCGLRMWQFVSRKLLRWLTLLPMATAFVTSFLLRREQFFLGAFAVQFTFYAVALLGLWWPRKSQAPGWLRIPFVFLLANLAVFTGVIDACRRKTFATWNIAELSRGPDPQGS